MKKGRFSKDDINYIEENIDVGLNRIATELNRNPDSVLDFIKKKVAKGEFKRPVWMEEPAGLEKAQYDLTFRPYWVELQQQFTEDELKLFQYHWARIISQFKDDVIPKVVRNLFETLKNILTPQIFNKDEMNTLQLYKILCDNLPDAKVLSHTTLMYIVFQIIIPYYADVNKVKTFNDQLLI